MEREELIIRYLDHELPPDKRLELEKLLAGDPEMQNMFDRLKNDRELIYKAVEGLNPVDDVEVPEFKEPGSGKLFRWRTIRYAAAAVFMIGLVVTLWLLEFREPGEEEQEITTLQESELEKDALDCYISPNRCWNKREIPLIIIKIK